MRRKKIGAINTETLLLIAAAGVGVYFFTKPKTVSPYVNPATGLPYNTGTIAYNPVAASNNNTTSSAIAAGAGVLTDVIDNLFG